MLHRTSPKLSSSLLALALAGALATPTQAQDVPDQTVSDDVIVITGSRIPSDPNLVSTTPVQSLDNDTIRLSGEINLADVVNDIPALISSTTGENSVTGANALSLRGLGTERTLTLVNGRRHVAGFRGTSAVDTGSIPEALVERVEVSTGGASAIYGADAVTGVVNFILKDDFEGAEFNAQGGISGEGDAENFSISGTVGKNFGEGRGNLTLSVGYVDDSQLLYGDRSWARGNGIASTEPRGNPLARFQPGDLGADTPNFNDLFGSYGGSIPAAADLPAGLTLTATEQALLARAAGAADRAVIQNPTFWLTSQAGSIAPGSFSGASRGVTYVDLNGNGIADCQESFVGQVGFLAGCWVTDDNGSARVFEDGQIVTGGLWGTGGDGGAISFDRDTLFPETDKLSINLNGKYDLAPGLTAFGEAKFVNSVSTTFGEQDTFYDTLFILPDNPYIPAELQAVADATGGLLLTQDPVDFNDDNVTEYERQTIRLVGGLRWETESGHNFEVSANHGRFKRTDDFEVGLLDRQFAALDAVRDESGNIVCRSDIDPDAAYEIDFFTFNNGFVSDYYTFTPGDGSCQPLNPFGRYSASEAAQNFLNEAVTDEIELTQTVLSGTVAGTFDVLDSFLDGAVGYAAGAEYRRETSENSLNSLTLGILPGSGLDITDVTDGAVNSFTSIDNDEQFNTVGSYDVREVFAELRVPIFDGQTLAEELSIDGAVRVADYSTSGTATTWKVGGVYSPVSDLSLRGTLSKSVRAPNISELFDPRLPITISATADPCDPDNVADGTANREANCIVALQGAGVSQADILDADGNYAWVNPLTGRFSGVSGGNPNLDKETSDTFTVGAVLQPRFVPNLSITVDYWDIQIDDAIAAVGADDILESCFDSSTFPTTPTCDQFTRRGDGGLDFLESGQTNFARLEASGIDFAANYGFDMGENGFTVGLVGSYQEKLDRFFNPSDLTENDPEVREIQLPKLSGNLNLGWERGPFALGFQTSYQSKQSVAEIEDVALYGDFGFFDETFIFDANGQYEVTEGLSVYGGVNNIADEQPFSTQTAWPVGPRGRFFFLGVNYKM